MNQKRGAIIFGGKTETAKVRTRDPAQKVDCKKRTKEATRGCSLSFFFFLRYYSPSSPPSVPPAVGLLFLSRRSLSTEQAGVEKEDAPTTRKLRRGVDVAESRWMFVLGVGEEGWKTGGADLQTALWRGWRMADSERKGKTEKDRNKKERGARKRDAKRTKRQYRILRWGERGRRNTGGVQG